MQIVISCILLFTATLAQAQYIPTIVGRSELPSAGNPSLIVSKDSAGIPMPEVSSSAVAQFSQVTTPATNASLPLFSGEAGRACHYLGDLHNPEMAWAPCYNNRNETIEFGPPDVPVVEIGPLNDPIIPLRVRDQVIAPMYRAPHNGGTVGLAYVNDVGGQVYGDGGNIVIEDGYIKLSAETVGKPPAADCSQDRHRNRISIDHQAKTIWVCGWSGWWQAGGH